MVIAARQANPSNAHNISFGAAVMLLGDTVGGTLISAADWLASGGGFSVGTGTTHSSTTIDTLALTDADSTSNSADYVRRVQFLFAVKDASAAPMLFSRSSGVLILDSANGTADNRSLRIGFSHISQRPNVDCSSRFRASSIS